ncbi:MULTISPECIES: TadE/TadG family type IV pilus assembly protein [Robertmurraya]|uniref:TadE/TadG family type IV pilus assembly protein n=1 Tax=Robertmurraya beringensis TaxID=641660 RepID=A0ABV6KVL9_9BACI
MRKLLKAYVKNERGSQAIEFLALFPLMLLSILLIWQIGLISFSLVVAESAARDGARAAAIHDGEWQAVARKSAAGIKIVDVRGGPGTDEAEVILDVKAPIVKLPLIADIDFTFTVDAVMPMEEKPDED